MGNAQQTGKFNPLSGHHWFPTPKDLPADRQGLNSFNQHICEILRVLWIYCTIKVILFYKPTH